MSITRCLVLSMCAVSDTPPAALRTVLIRHGITPRLADRLRDRHVPRCVGHVVEGQPVRLLAHLHVHARRSALGHDGARPRVPLGASLAVPVRACPACPRARSPPRPHRPFHPRVRCARGSPTLFAGRLRSHRLRVPARRSTPFRSRILAVLVAWRTSLRAIAHDKNKGQHKRFCSHVSNRNDLVPRAVFPTSGSSADRHDTELRGARKSPHTE